MYASPTSRLGIWYWPLVGAIALVGATGFAALASWIGSQCQCHYTPALFAERDGLKRIVLPIHVVGEQRREFVTRLEALRVFVDPAYARGASDVAAVFAPPDQIEAVRSVARPFAPFASTHSARDVGGQTSPE
jgi:hypothetical protein